MFTARPRAWRSDLRRGGCRRAIVWYGNVAAAKPICEPSVRRKRLRSRTWMMAFTAWRLSTLKWVESGGMSRWKIRLAKA